MNAARGNADNDLPGFDLFSVNNLISVRDPYTETCQVKITVGVESGHLSRFAANQGAACLLTALGDALNDFHHPMVIEFSDREIIKKKKRLGAQGQNVIHIHSDEVYAEPLIAFAVHREL